MLTDCDRDALYSVRQAFVGWRRNSDSTARDDDAIGHLVDAIDQALELTECDDSEQWQRAIERVQTMLTHVCLMTNDWGLQDMVGAQYRMLVGLGVIE